ncbi:MAG TPA: copper-translocating P-type ATPase [Chryseosolibacter sp.]|nr:copper-translocating P-type ATPase [Chryseosolibacter sp.]
MKHEHQQYTCPMHPEVIKDAPGKCPKCGMDLIPLKSESIKPLGGHRHSPLPNHQETDAPRHPHAGEHVHHASEHEDHGGEHAGHGGGHAHHAGMIDDFKKRFYVVLVLTLPIMALSPMIQHWLNVNWSFPGSNYVLLILSSVVFFYGGWPFLTGFIDEIKSRSLGMMTLIAVAITVAYVYSVAVVLGLEGMDFFWELATLILIMLLGHWIEMKSIMGASRELELLVQLMPSEAHLVHGDHVMDVKTDTLNAGDVILVKPGEKIAADGEIVEGTSYLNESMLTGESKPVEKDHGDKVIAGSINGEGSLKVRVTHGAKDSYLSQVIKLVQDAQNAKSRTQLLADNAAKWLTIIALTSGTATLIVWLALGKDLAFAMERMVTVIVICCPHALGLAVPLVVAHSTAISAKSGLLIKDRTAFENSRKISTLVFDKTGTLTKGEFNVVRYDALDSRYKENEVLSFAATLEQNSEHPIATGIMRKAKELNLQLPALRDFKAITGKGIQANVNGKSVKVVSPGYLKEHNLTSTVPTSTEAETTVYVLVDDSVIGFVSLADEIRPESADAIEVLHKQKIKTLLLTGDNKHVAATVSESLGMNGFIAEVLPHQKLEKIKELQSKGEFVAMTGDGVNDAPALAQADVGIAVGSGSDIAAETADIVLVNSNPRDVANLIVFGKATYRKMIQNLAWATGYNVIALPLAAGILYNAGVMLSPAMGAVLMSVSTIVVAINARMLKLK